MPSRKTAASNIAQAEGSGIRAALGASRGRLLRQLSTEALVVSLLGGAAGLLLASLLLGMLNRWQSPYGHLAVGVDGRVYLTALVLALVSALLFALSSARQVWQSNPSQAMKSGAVDTVTLRGFGPRDLLLGVQIAICTLLAAVCSQVRFSAPRSLRPVAVSW